MSLQDFEFIVLDPSTTLTEALGSALKEHVPEPIYSKISVVNRKLSDLKPPHSYFDCIVSPANSYGRLDGGFDWFISLALAPKDDVHAVTKIAQSILYERRKGYAPPGTCTLLPLSGTVCEGNPHKCAYVALVPTMRIPETIRWNREIVYNCVWSLLSSLTQHNSSFTDNGFNGSEPKKIRKVVMTGLGTGVGSIPAETYARQTALAIKHFWDAECHPDKWRSLSWRDAQTYSWEVTPRDFERASFFVGSSRSIIPGFRVIIPASVLALASCIIYSYWKL